MAGSADVRSAWNVLEPAGGVPLKNAKSWHSHVSFVRWGMLVGLAWVYAARSWSGGGCAGVGAACGAALGAIGCGLAVGAG